MEVTNALGQLSTASAYGADRDVVAVMINNALRNLPRWTGGGQGLKESILVKKGSVHLPQDGLGPEMAE